jgi:hypothetical protein
MVKPTNKPKPRNMEKSSSKRSYCAAHSAAYSLLILLLVTSGCKKTEPAKVNAEATNPTSSNGDQKAGPVQVDLRSAADFSILAKSGISTTGTTSISGDIGVSPIAATAITGFGLTMDGSDQFSSTPIVTGKVYAADYATPSPTKLGAAVSDMENAYTTANGLTTPTAVVGLNGGDLSGQVLTPGIYKWSSGVSISKKGLTLVGGPDDTWVFQIAQDLTLTSGARITLTGGAMAKNIYWVTAGKATLGTDTHLCGTILSKTMISLNTGAVVTGRLLAQTAVTSNASKVNQPKH